MADVVKALVLLVEIVTEPVRVLVPATKKDPIGREWKTSS